MHEVVRYSDHELWRAFGKSGQLETETPMVKEGRHGVEKVYDARGTVIELRTYDRGKLVSTKKLSPTPTRAPVPSAPPAPNR